MGIVRLRRPVPRAIEVREVPGVEEALATRDPVASARRILEILRGGEDRKEVVRSAALAAARRFAPALPPPHGLPALSAALDLARHAPDSALVVAQACALAASEWRAEPLEGAGHAINGDELHLAQSFRVAVRGGEVRDADAIFSGLLREGDERRLAGDALFELCAQDLAGEAHKLPFAVATWRLARSLGWLRGPVLMRPAVHLAAMPSQDLTEYGSAMREVGRARLDLELAARNVAPLDGVARNTFGIALGAGPDRLVADLIAGLKRGRAPAGYADLIAATAAERLIGEPKALEPALFAFAVRFVLGFSRTSTHTLAVLQAARLIASVHAPDPVSAVRVPDPAAGLADLDRAIEAGNPREAARLALGLVEATEPEAIVPHLVRQAALADAEDGHRLLYAAAAVEFVGVAPGAVLASLAAVLARAPASRAVAEAVSPSS